MDTVYLIYYNSDGVLSDICAFIDAECVSMQRILMKCTHASSGSRYEIYYRKNDDSLLENGVQ